MLNITVAWVMMLALLSGLSLARAEAPIPVYTYEVVHAWPHDSEAFTQGLFYQDGVLYESTGLNGRSSVRKVQLESGRVLQKRDLPDEYFGEGIVAWDGRLISLTWTSQVGFIFDLKSFAPVGRFQYFGQGWGLTRNEHEIIMSDGTSELRVLEPATLHVLRRISVTAQGHPVDQLNELEWVQGRILANVWQTDRIASIDPQTGRVEAWIDLSGLLPRKDRASGHPDVLNGIAYDAAGDRLFVTGKLWPKLFEIRLVPARR